jgi:pimeloyl-ACP methyl ester carboxylesterase
MRERAHRGQEAQPLPAQPQSHSLLRLLPGVGHLPMADAPELIAATILNFTGETKSTTPQHSGTP